ncbi:MAG: hypothetical protein ACYC8T_30505 [Myxococcaceae bacterium]
MRSHLYLAVLVLGSCRPSPERLRVPPGSGATLGPGTASICRIEGAPAVLATERWHGDALHWTAAVPGKAMLRCSGGTSWSVEVVPPTAVTVQGPSSLKVGEVVELKGVAWDGTKTLDLPAHGGDHWAAGGGVALEGGACEFPPWCTCGGFHGKRCGKGERAGPASVEFELGGKRVSHRLLVLP